MLSLHVSINAAHFSHEKYMYVQCSTLSALQVVIESLFSKMQLQARSMTDLQEQVSLDARQNNPCVQPASLNMYLLHSFLLTFPGPISQLA